MKADEIRTTKAEERDGLEARWRAERVKLELGVRLGQGGNSAKLTQLKRDIARLITIRREHELGLPQSQRAVTAPKEKKAAKAEKKGKK